MIASAHFSGVMRFREGGWAEDDGGDMDCDDRSGDASTADWRRSVETDPGYTMQTATSCFASSMRRDLKKPVTANFVEV